MTTMLDEAVEKVRALPEAEQELAADVLMQLVHRHDPAYRLTPDQVEEVRRTLKGLEDGTVRVLSDQEVEEMWRRLGA